MSRILLTGGAGFIGSHLADALLDDGHDIVILDNFSSGNRSNLAGISDKADLVEGDVRNLGDFASAIGPVDIIIHLAALISGYDSLADPDAYVSANITGLQRVIDFGVLTGKPRILFASSSTVYGNQGQIPLHEEVRPDPLSVYAMTKLAGEHLLRMYGTMHDFSHCSLRLFNVYGPRQAVDHPYANVTCKFAHAAANGLPVKLFGDGNQSRDFIFVADVVRAFRAVLHESKRQIYNVGTGASASINELIEALGSIGGAPLRVEQYDDWPNDIRSIRADPARFEQDFGFRPVIEIDVGLRQTVEYFRRSARS